MFDLTITFAGICLLVRDQANDRLHVLMPTSPATMPHFPALVFVNALGKVEKVDIPAGTDIDLTPVKGSNGLNVTMPAGVFDFDGPPYGTRTVDRSLVDPTKPFPGGVGVRARLAAGEFKPPLRRPGGIWDIDVNGSTTTHRIATAVDWVIKNVDLPNLTVNLGTAGTKVVPLIGKSMHVLLVHVMQPELDAIGDDIPENAECPDDQDLLEHLKLYFPVLTPNTEPGPDHLPKFNRSETVAAGIKCPPLPTPATDLDSRAVETVMVEAAAGSDADGLARRAAETVTAAASGEADAASDAMDAEGALIATDALVAVAARFAAANNSGSELTCTVATVRAG